MIKIDSIIFFTNRYLEAESYNNKLKHSKPRGKEVSTSYESLFDMLDRDNARDALVEVMCGALPAITNAVASHARDLRDVDHGMSTSLWH